MKQKTVFLELPTNATSFSPTLMETYRAYGKMALCKGIVEKILGSSPATINATVSLVEIDGAVPIVVNFTGIFLKTSSHYNNCWHFPGEQTKGSDVGMFEFAYYTIEELLCDNDIPLDQENTIWLKVEKVS
jgi:hypothetical protein